jgi:hypothetical protein
MTRIQFFLIAILLFTASTAWPRIAGERPVSDPLYGLAPGGKWPAVVATDGDGFLTVWSDVRSWPDAIYAARVSAHGEPLDRTGIRIALGFDPSVVFAGDSYSVFWLDYSANSGTLHIARIDREGRIIDGPRVVADGVPRIAFAAATNGRRIVIAWPERLFVLSAEGELLERDIRIQNDCHTPYCEGTPLVASNGSGFLVALPFQGRVLAVALDANGHPLSSGIKFDSDAVPIALTSDGSNYLVVDAAPSANATSQQINASGALLAHNDLGARLDNMKTIALIWNGTDYVALSRANFADAPRVTLRLTWSGFVLQLPPAGEAVLSRGAVASNGRTLFAAWNGGASTSAAAILTERLDPSTLTATPPTVITFSATTQLNPSIAFSGTNYAVVWNESQRSWLRRVSLTGEPIDPQPVPLDTFVGRSSSSPRVTFDGKNYVAAALTDTPTQNGRLHIRLTRIDPTTGQILSAFDGPDAFSDTTFDLRSDGTNVVMAWSWSGELRAAQIGMTNVVNQNTITSPTVSAFAPSLAWSGTQWLVSYNYSLSLGFRILSTTLGGGETPFEHHVYAVRLSPALAVLDPQPIELGIPDVTFSDPFIDTHAASVDGDFIVAMTNVQSRTVLLRRIFADGSIAPDVQRLGAGVALDIEADHGRYAVAIANPVAPGFQQFVTYVDRNGVASSRDAFPLAFTVWTGILRAQLAVGLDGIVAAYQRTAFEPLYGGVERVFLRSSSSEGRGRAAASR